MNHEKEYKDYKDSQIKSIGLDPKKLTQDQIDIILEPIEAPENYMCDGEITQHEAKRRWEGKLKQAGFTPLQVFNISKKIIR